MPTSLGVKGVTIPSSFVVSVIERRYLRYRFKNWSVYNITYNLILILSNLKLAGGRQLVHLLLLAYPTYVTIVQETNTNMNSSPLLVTQLSITCLQSFTKFLSWSQNIKNLGPIPFRSLQFLTRKKHVTDTRQIVAARARQISGSITVFPNCNMRIDALFLSSLV